jgi:CheY-like chemotaxis protein
MSDQALRVLVVDDEASGSKLLTLFVKVLKGYEVIAVASDGLEAVNLVKKLDPDVVLLDYMMPNMDGAVAAEAMRVNGSTAKIIMVSAMAGNPKVVRRAQAAGVDAILRKPISASELLAVLNRATASHQA